MVAIKHYAMVTQLLFFCDNFGTMNSAGLNKRKIEARIDFGEGVYT